jgi:beta-mannosidase
MSPELHPVMTLEHWALKDFAPGETPSAGDLAAQGDGWLPVDAPGDTYLALHAAGRIPHPFAAENEAACAWVKDREWCWRTTFDAPPPRPDERVVIVFEGLDTFATIWVNGVQVGTTSNMFLERRIDIGRVLRAAPENEVIVRFAPPASQVSDKQMETWPIIADPITESKRNFIRKAQFGWGWDWGPRLPTVGIWRPVRIERQHIATIADVRFETLELGPTARVAATVTVDAFVSAPLDVSTVLTDDTGTVVASARIDPARVRRVELLVDHPRLWWTPELGEATLYTLTVTLSSHGAELARRECRVGIRTITLDMSSDPEEPRCNFFRFILNGVPIFARGANWVPASSFVGALTAANYADLLERAAAANMNMIRVWGGGIYEHDAFYDECDRRGLLVWQDFMFACAPYPEHEPDFVASVRDEVAHQIRRLRSHACLALWCGNNEGDAVQAFMNQLTGKNEPFPGDLFIHAIIPQTLAELDPATPYRPGSPYGGPSHNSMRAGDVHNWTVWHGLPPTPDDLPIGTFDHSPEGVAYTRYAEDMSRFVSEFGIQAAPALTTLARWMQPETMQLGSVGFLNRIKDHPKDKVNAMLLPVTGLPGTLQQYVDFTQVTQAEGLKYGIEHYRRRKPHCSGTLLWQYNDCWPGISWSILDHDGVAKPSWYVVRRAFAPVIASFKPLDGDGIELWITNDTVARIDLKARIGLATFGGSSLFTAEVEASVPATSSVAIWRGDPPADPARVLWFRSPQCEGNRHFFAAIKDLPLEPRAPTMAIEPVDPHTLKVTLTATSYVYGARLLGSHAATRYSNNFLDLCAGESRSIIVSNLVIPLMPEDVTLHYGISVGEAS